MTTMRRRLLAGFTALALALFGVIVLARWVQSADERARADEELVPVLVVDEAVPAGSDAITVGSAVSTVEVPSRLVADNAMTSLDHASGKVTTDVLLPGEQLLEARFVDPATLLPDGTVARPAGLIEISVTLEPQRALGGQLDAGDRVGVLVTTPVTAPGSTQAVPVSRPAFPGDVLVTRVVSSTTGDPNAASTGAGSPTDTVTVTLAVSLEQAPAITAGAELGTVWLTLVTDAAQIDSTLTTPGGDK